MSDVAVDTSAIVELMIKGPQAQVVRDAMAGAGRAFVTPVTRLEAVMVMLGRFGWERAAFDHSWRGLALREIPVDSTMAELAIDAFEAAQAFDPEGKERAEILAELYASDVGQYLDKAVRSDRKSTRLNSSHSGESRMPSSA